MGKNCEEGKNAGQSFLAETESQDFSKNFQPITLHLVQFNRLAKVLCLLHHYLECFSGKYGIEFK